MMEKAAKCETAEQLIALAKTEGFEITKAEAEAYLTEIDNMELDSESLDKVAGGGCYGDNPCGNFWIA
ncbi:MAG: Nif11 family protein [Spirochaetia bacterium]|nr:Nif11 family protein [Spirochaetia bacterium]